VSAVHRRETLPLGNAPTFPNELWWVAAGSTEIGSALLGRRIADRPMVFYRTEEGTVVALDDVCPHRWLPLSKGCREGDQIRCGYHGLLFNADGTCAEVPSQAEAPSRVAVRSYPVVERAPWVWVWTGEPERADPVDIPAHPWLSDPTWRTIHGHLPLAANYLRGHENVLDLSHFEYLHPGSVGTDEWTTVQPSVHAVDGELHVVRDLPASPAAPNVAAMGIAPASLVDRHTDSRVPTPAVHIALTTLRSPAGHGQEHHQAILHAFTPETERTSHYFFAVARDWRLDDLEFDEQFLAMTRAVFGQDKKALEAIEQVALTHPGPLREISVRADQPGLQLRRLVKQRIAAEAAEHGRL
jgi:phenylpropionate dioxygenase-like ring-hydroxylating dioxygenase large terminal subunit